MGYTISDNYSVLNNYDYNNKSSIISALDWLSTPCRRVLGGRNVYVLSANYEEEMSTACKVATAFFSVLIFPVAIISTASLIAKLVTFPCIWEKKKVQVQSQQTWDVINQFDEAFKKGDYDNAIQLFKKRPNIGDRKDIKKKLFEIINFKINNHTSWGDVQKLLPYLSIRDAISLIDHAVKTKLSDEMEKDCFITQAKDIKLFIRNSLRNVSMADLEACYKKLFSSALKVDVNDDLLLIVIKMELADYMIRTLTQMRKSNANDEINRLLAEVNETPLRHSIFDENQDHIYYYLTFQSKEDMKKINAAVQNLRDVSQMGWESVNKINALHVEKSIHPQEQWNNIRSEVIKFQVNLEILNSSLDEGEKQYVSTFQSVYSDMVKLFDAVWESTSAEEIEKILVDLKNSLNEHKIKPEEFFQGTEVSYNKTTTENLLSVLRLKKTGQLYVFTKKMESFFVENMAQLALRMTNKTS